jgi:hypothetical protein
MCPWPSFLISGSTLQYTSFTLPQKRTYRSAENGMLLVSILGGFTYLNQNSLTNNDLHHG